MLHIREALNQKLQQRTTTQNGLKENIPQMMCLNQPKPQSLTRLKRNSSLCSELFLLSERNA